MLRGIGKQKFGAILNAVSYYGVGLPLGAVLLFVARIGVIGTNPGHVALHAPKSPARRRSSLPQLHRWLTMTLLPGSALLTWLGSGHTGVDCNSPYNYQELLIVLGKSNRCWAAPQQAPTAIPSLCPC